MSEAIQDTVERAIRAFSDEPTPAALAGRVCRERGTTDGLEALVAVCEQSVEKAPEPTSGEVAA